MAIRMTWLGIMPEPGIAEQARLTIQKQAAFLQAGCAVVVGTFQDSVPPEHWFVNRVILEPDGIHVVLEKGNPLSPILKDEIQKASIRLVAELADKPMTPQAQAQHLTDFVAELMKGRLYAGA